MALASAALSLMQRVNTGRQQSEQAGDAEDSKSEETLQTDSPQGFLYCLPEPYASSARAEQRFG